MFNNNDIIYIDRLSKECVLSNNKFVKLYNFFYINWYKISNDINKSNIVILDLCWTFDNYINISLEKIDRYLRLNKYIILIWCIDKLIVDKFKWKWAILNFDSYKDVNIYFENTINIDNIKYSLVKDFNRDKYLDTNYQNLFKNFHDFIFVEISTWCNFNCSYCNIKKIKWKTKSIAINEIISMINVWIKLWKKDIFLLSDECWWYWTDINNDFIKLLDYIFSIDSEIFIYISNIHPFYLIKYYNKIKKYVYSNKIKFILVPTQHTSSRILKLMNRNYNVDDLKKILFDIKQKSNIILHNHIIYDYPTETFDEFKDTLSLLKFYDKTFYNRYSNVNNLPISMFNHNDTKEKIILLRKLQSLFNIDLMTNVKD